MTALKRYIAEVADFPRPGILFRDIAPLLRSHFGEALDAIEALFPASLWQRVDALAGVESRGFIFAAGLAGRLRKGFVPIRKQGKLPPPVVAAPYELEYGSGILEMQPGLGSLLLLDDVVATGGTLKAAAGLCVASGYEVSGVAALIDLRLAGEFRWGEQVLRAAVSYG